MSRRPPVFGALLERVGSGLPVPMFARVRFLEELDADLRALTDRLVAEGHSPHEARRRATEALVPDSGTADQLTRLHEPWYDRLTRGVEAARLRRAERAAWVASMVLLLVVQGALLATTNLSAYASPFLLPVLVLGTTTLVVAAAQAFRIWIKGDVAKGSLPLVLGLAITTFGTGVGGVIIDLYRLAATLERSPELMESLMTYWLVRDAGLLAVSILLALAGAMAWFLCAMWVTAVEQAHREIVGTSTQSNP